MLPYSDAVRLSVDTEHAQLMRQRSGPPPQIWIETVVPYLGHHVHLCDNDTTNDQHIAPGGGTTLWGSVERALHKPPKTVRLLVEVKAFELGLGPVPRPL